MIIVQKFHLPFKRALPYIKILAVQDWLSYTVIHKYCRIPTSKKNKPKPNNEPGKDKSKKTDQCNMHPSHTKQNC